MNAVNMLKIHKAGGERGWDEVGEGKKWGRSESEQVRKSRTENMREF